MLSSSAGIGSLTDPLALEDYVDGDGIPQQFIPYAPDEIEYNTPFNPDDRIALYPAGIVPTGRNKAVVLFEKFNVVTTRPPDQPPSVDYKPLGMGIATVYIRPPGHVPRIRVSRERRWLFKAGEPFKVDDLHKEPVFFATFVTGTTRLSYVYLYDKFDRLARVQLRSVHLSRFYEFWNGATWTSDVTRLPPQVAMTLPLNSVGHNAYLGGYLSTTVGWANNELAIRTASLPEGPWSAWTMVDVGAAAYQKPNFFNWHSAYGDGQKIVFSYVVVNADGTSEIRVYRLTLQTGDVAQSRRRTAAPGRRSIEPEVRA
jgi:hypothetical protein